MAYKCSQSVLRVHWQQDGGRLQLERVETVSASFLKCRLQWLQPGYFSPRVEKLFCQCGTLCFQRFLCEGQSEEKN